MRLTLAERFWQRVATSADPEACWQWTGAKDSHGYGAVRDAAGVLVGAHRLAFEIAHGHPLPAGAEACHTCDNPGCVRPSHIFAGSHRENHVDAVRKGRYARRRRKEVAA